MKRMIALVSVVLLAAGLAGCSGPAANSMPPGSPETSGTVSVDGPYAAIAIDGPNEANAVDSLSSALKTAAEAAKAQGKTPPDLSGATATLVAYQLYSRVGDQVALFEVRANGRAYELFRYPTPPAPKALKWTPAAYAEGAVMVDPSSNAERGAVAAVMSITKIAKPSSKPVVRISAYSFYWIKADGTPVQTKDGGPFNLTVDPKGAAASWSL
jgi:hypothetical protein